MTKNHNIDHLVRNDGKLAFSYKGKRLAETRMNSANGRVQKVLGKLGPFTPSFKMAVLGDYDNILERHHLAKELEGHKKVMNALASPNATKEQTDLLKRLQEDPRSRKSPCVLCPFWKHRNTHDLVLASVSRYLFPEKIGEVFLLTIVFDFAQNLFELAQKIEDARHSIRKVIRQMNKREQGLMIFGAFEPDLRSIDELNNRKKGSSKLLTQLGIDPPSTGGWGLSGHFLVRVPHHESFRSILQEAYPSSGWNRVRFDPVHRNKNMAGNVMDVMGYLAKYPEPIFKHDNRGEKRRSADAQYRRIAAVFSGPSISSIDKRNFDVNTAIRQWAEFMDTMGPEKLMFSLETSWAQRWHSQSEWQYIRATDVDMVGLGMNLIEPHKGRDFYYTGKTSKRLVGKLRRLSDRQLRYDDEWYRTTDISGIDHFTTAVDLHQWMYKKT